MQMWNLSFGFFGVQIAYALQSANISRIFATLGADPHTLSYFNNRRRPPRLELFLDIAAADGHARAARGRGNER